MAGLRIDPTGDLFMAISMYTASVPILARQLKAMLTWLDKAEAQAKSRNYDPSVFLQSRLAPDMLPLVSQVRIAADSAKGCAARLAGLAVPKFEDNEATLDELRARIRKTVDYIESVPAASFEGSEERAIELPNPRGEPRRFKGQAYLQHWALPNFFFHCTTTYALLRQGGVELGKADFLAA
jgi:uncharacterized protein